MSDSITVIGNIAAEPEQRRTANGASFTSFRLGATSRRYDQERGQWIDESTNWYRVLVYRRLGEHALASLHRGERVIVTGRLRVREWESGDKRGTSVEITADGVGHDLLWGTTAFRGKESDSSASSSPGSSSLAPEQRAAVVGASGWAVPAAPEQEEPTPF